MVSRARKGSYDYLYDFATTDREREIIQAVRDHGAVQRAGKALGLGERYMYERIRILKGKAAKQGLSPEHDMTHEVAPGFNVKGTSTLYDKDGNASIQWVKTSADQRAREEAARAALEAMCEDIPRVEALPSPKHTDAKLLNCYVLTDYHLGMLSHDEETGADWDVRIAEKMLMRWFERAIAQSPDSKTAVLAQLGDMNHADTVAPLTPQSGHILDVDTRLYKVVRTIIRCMRRIVDMLLAKHKQVHLIFADANHDPVSQIWLREWFAALYEREPRLSCDLDPSPYAGYEFGKVALFFHHGHKRKTTNVSEVFAAKFREMFGRTQYAYAHMGHLHSAELRENNLMIVEQHRTLAAPDAYAARGGWLSGRDAKVITYHRDYGEVSRLTINSDMLR